MEGQGPMQFGPYVVLEQIGSGGMGAVYRARDRRLERDVAIKVLHRHLEVMGARERFLREARAVSSLNHPNISTIFDIGEQDGDPYLVMELLHGESLKEILRGGAKLPEDRILRIATHAAMALAAAHAKGIIHRDIKPANLFLAEAGTGEPQLKILDFGLAKLESEGALDGAVKGLTRTGSTVGTVEYMSPEQARGEALDTRSDLFSLGAVLYELATGDVPFRGATSAVVFAELLGSEPVPPRQANGSVSSELDAIIRGLLQKTRESRTPSASALLDALRAFREPPLMPLPQSTPLTSTQPHVSFSEPQPSPAPLTSSGDAVPAIARLPKSMREPIKVTDPSAWQVRVRPQSSSRPSTVRLVRTMEDVSSVQERLTSAMPVDTRDEKREPQQNGLAPEDRFGERAEAGGIRWWIPALIALLLAGLVAAFFFGLHDSNARAATHGTQLGRLNAILAGPTNRELRSKPSQFFD